MSMISQAQAWIGKNAADGSHRFIIDIYNDQDKLPRGYKVKYTDMWCATFVTVCAIVAGLTDVIPPECGCGKMIEGFQKLGEWVENDAYVPQTEDIIFYDWQDSGIGDNTGYPDHVGIVEKVEGNIITVIEGNMGGNGGRVGRREIPVNGKTIRGYGVPKRRTYKPEPKPSPQPIPQAEPQKAEEKPQQAVFYRVQTGAYKVHENAMNTFQKLKNLGYDAFVVEVNDMYKVQVGAYTVKANAEKMLQKIKADGFDGYITQSTGNRPDPGDYTLNFQVKVKCALNIRKGPGINYEVADVIEDNGVYTIVDTQGHWGKLKNGKGWISIHENYVTKL